MNAEPRRLGETLAEDAAGLQAQLELLLQQPPRRANSLSYWRVGRAAIRFLSTCGTWNQPP
jgi:hypothetical protein